MQDKIKNDFKKKERLCTVKKTAGRTPVTGHNVAYLNQLFSVLVQLFQNGQCLLRKAMLQYTLDHSAPIGVCGQSKHLHNTCTVNTHTNAFHV